MIFFMSLYSANYLLGPETVCPWKRATHHLPDRAVVRGSLLAQAGLDVIPHVINAQHQLGLSEKQMVTLHVRPCVRQWVADTWPKKPVADMYCVGIIAVTISFMQMGVNQLSEGKELICCKWFGEIACNLWTSCNCCCRQKGRGGGLISCKCQMSRCPSVVIKDGQVEV